MKPKVVKVDPNQPDPKVIREAVTIMSAGGVIAYPTDTVYGLGVDPRRDEYIRRIYQVKKRVGKAIPILLSGVEQVERYGYLNDIAEKLIDAFWPGHLTVIVEAKPTVSELITMGTGKVGLRVPDHKVALMLARELGGAITGTSANISGMESPRTAGEVLSQLGASIDMIIDGGPCKHGISSTVVDTTVRPVKILRVGPVRPSDIERVLGLKPIVETD